MPGISAPPGPLLAGVVAERPGGRELAELVADHRLGHVDRDVATTVVDGDGVADHVGDDRRPAGPGLDDPLLTGGVEGVDLLQQVVVDERALLEAARHWTDLPLPPGPAGAAAADDQLVGFLVAGGGGGPPPCPPAPPAGGRRG